MMDELREAIGKLTARIAEIESLLAEKGIERKPPPKAPEANVGTVKIDEDPDDIGSSKSKKK